MSWLAGLAHDERGSSALEFAIVAMAFFLVLFGTIEFGRLLFYQSALAGAVGSSGRELLLDPSTPSETLKAVILDRMPAAAADRLTVAVSNVSHDGTAYHRVSASYSFEFILDTLFDIDVTLTEDLSVPRAAP
jgi:Flp pilus assembly protein TadG